MKKETHKNDTFILDVVVFFLFSLALAIYDVIRIFMCCTWRNILFKINLNKW